MASKSFQAPGSSGDLFRSYSTSNALPLHARLLRIVRRQSSAPAGNHHAFIHIYIRYMIRYMTALRIECIWFSIALRTRSAISTASVCAL